jgi:hypothetical protein
MGLQSTITGFLDKSVTARFKHDAQGRLVFFPWGFGAGRLVTDAAAESRLRRAARVSLAISLFGIAPVVGIFAGVVHPTGLVFVAYIAACAAIGFSVQAYPWWLSRRLAPSQERLSYPGAMLASLQGYGRKFLVFGLLSSALFTLVGVLVTVFGGPEVDKIAMLICIAIFAPMTAVYAVALRRRSAAGA